MPSGPRPAPPTLTARVAIHTARSGAHDAVNVLWFHLASASPAQADLDAVVDLIAAKYNTRFTAFLSTGTTLVEAKASWITGLGTVLESDRTFAYAMTGGTGIDNFASCYVVNWKIPDYYRGGKPRTYLPSVVQSAVTDGRTLTTSARSNLGTAAVNFMNDCNAITSGGITSVQLGTVRFQSHDVWLAPPVFRQYSSAAVRSIMGTQRRRLD